MIYKEIIERLDSLRQLLYLEDYYQIKEVLIWAKKNENKARRVLTNVLAEIDVKNKRAVEPEFKLFEEEAHIDFRTTVNTRRFFIDLENLEQAIVTLQANMYGDLLAENLSDKLGITGYINKFSNSFEEYLNSTNKLADIYQLIIEANHLSSLISDHQKLISSVIKLLTPEVPVETEDYQAVSIYMESDLTYSQFSLKIEALSTIYNEIADIMDISVIDHPIQIIKIETGSFLSEVLAYPKIISLVVELIENSIAYFYNNFTSEGKIAVLPRKVESLEAVLELRKKLKAIGVDTTDLDESLKKSSIVIAEKLNHLLLGESKVKVNGKLYYIGEDFEMKYLEEGKKFLLPETIAERKK